MSLISDIRSLDANHFLLASAMLVGLLVPGILTLYTFDRSFLIESGAITTIVLAISVTSPSFAMLFVTTLIGVRVFSEMKPETAENFGGFTEWAITHSISNACIFFFVLFLHTLIGFPFCTFALFVLIFLVSYLLYEFYRLILLAKGRTTPYFRDPGNRES
jgi:hypothetical protein